MIFFYLMVFGVLIMLIFYLIPNSEKIGGWILNKIKTKKGEDNNGN